MITNDIYYNEINRLKNIVANSLKYRNVPVIATDNAYKNLVKLYSEHEIDIVINEMIDNPVNPMWAGRDEVPGGEDAQARHALADTAPIQRYQLLPHHGWRL